MWLQAQQVSISQSSLPLEPGVALASWRSEPNKHKNGHSWLQPLLPHGPPFVPHADTRSPAPSPAACCSLKLLFTYIHLPVSSWVLDIRAAGPGCQEADRDHPIAGFSSSRTLPQSPCSLLCICPRLFSLHRDQLYLWDFTHY